jgi:hypothetical protein
LAFHQAARAPGRSAIREDGLAGHETPNTRAVIRSLAVNRSLAVRRSPSRSSMSGGGSGLLIGRQAQSSLAFGTTCDSYECEA